ncbi:membrane protease YdiL (CAAX protease family) [Caulobacter ginsengisoli]|uniref:Membrane protease YdiL (CAAX protease family) n=1 Tax=Caulobacter ginsengisoli TaxID=400775 RepID=A0ABU0IV49_9CAUL|nr:type II CAAX endopeptidase family protein [Caulobacter ginsengisoli]MDQ0465874.1 membrane protease YdiL (CAAX protease family) [Caulobacter ginsengisoli]
MKPTAIYAPDPAQGWLPWGFLAPVLCLLFVVVTALGPSLPLEHFGLADRRGDPVGLTGLIAFLLLPFAALGLVVLGWVKVVERRPLATIGLTRPGGTAIFLRGLLIGAATIAAVVAGVWLAGGLRAGGLGAGSLAPALASPAALANIVLLLACFAVQSSVEEIVFRGWLLSAVARKLNVAWAIGLTTLVFTLLHYGPHQPWHVTLTSALFSVFACCWALRAGNIWGVMGWHAGWNWLLAVGFELPVTGLSTGTPALLVRLIPQGPAWLTGGADGPEGSVVCNLFFLVGIALLAWRRPRVASA